MSPKPAKQQKTKPRAPRKPVTMGGMWLGDDIPNPDATEEREIRKQKNVRKEGDDEVVEDDVMFDVPLAKKDLYASFNRNEITGRHSSPKSSPKSSPSQGTGPITLLSRDTIDNLMIKYYKAKADGYPQVPLPTDPTTRKTLPNKVVKWWMTTGGLERIQSRVYPNGPPTRMNNRHQPPPQPSEPRMLDLPTTVVVDGPGADKLHWSPDSSKLFMLTQHGMEVWSRDTETVVQDLAYFMHVRTRLRIQMDLFSADAFALSPDCLKLATANTGYSLDYESLPFLIFHVLNANDGTLIKQFKKGVFLSHRNRVRDMAWSPDGSLILTTSFGKTVKIWRASNGRLVRTLKHPDISEDNMPPRAEWSPDGSMIAGKIHGIAYIWRVSNGALLHRIYINQDRYHNWKLDRLSWSPNGSMLAFACERCPAPSKGLHVYRASDAQLIRILSCESTRYDYDQLYGIAWSPDSTMVACAMTMRMTVPNNGDDLGHVLRIWNLDSGEVVLQTRITNYIHRSGVSSMAWSPDGNFVSVSVGGSVILVNVAAHVGGRRTLEKTRNRKKPDLAK